ncbi:MAG TPA: hypothetical protein VFW21_15840 [Mycobacterium sp.]|nr:hypothetical protein [Mycobacterium sp.]
MPAHHLHDAGCRARFLIRDREGKYPTLFDAILADTGIQTGLTGVRMPRMNSGRTGLLLERLLSCQAAASREVSNLLDGWTEIGSAAMIFEAVAEVARETPAAFGLAR